MEGFSQGLGASQAFDFNITESQLQSQVDFSFLDFNQTQEAGGAGAFDDYADLSLPQASQVGQCGSPVPAAGGPAGLTRPPRCLRCFSGAAAA